MTDAAFREALDAVVQEAFEVGKARGRRDTVRMGELATRVLALYAAREGEILCDWVAGVDDDIWATACGKYYQVDVEALTAVAEFGVVHCPCGGRIVVNAAP